MLDQLGQSISNPNLALSSSLKKRIEGALGQMRSGQGMSQEMLEQLQQLSEEMAGMCQGTEPGDGMGFGEGEGNQSGPDGDGNPGRGAPNRGRGDAPMFFGEERRIDAKTKPEEMRNQFLDPADLVDLGITPVEPQPDPGAFSLGTLRQFDRQSGAAVSRTRITPSQKDVVSRYFGEKE